MKNKVLVLMFACLLAACTLGVPPLTLGKTYHVATNGDDAEPGSETWPFRTIGKAASVARPGDTILIHGGVYYEDVKPNYSGRPGKFITYKNFGDGEVIIDAENGQRAGCIEIDNKSYLQFTGLTVRGAILYSDWPRAGIAVTDGSNNIILDNIKAYDNYFGIMAYGKDTPVITVKNSITFDPGTNTGNVHYGIFFYMKVYDSNIINNHAAYALPEVQSYGIEVSTNHPGVQADGPRRIVISGNEVDHNESQGIHTWNAVGVLISGNHLHDNGATGIQIEDGSENVVIENNLSENNAQFYEYETGAWMDHSKNVLVRNNIFRSNKIGLNITDSDRVIIHDNTIYLNDRGAENLINAAGLIVKNNVSNISITQNTFYQNSAGEAQLGGINFRSNGSNCDRISFINNIVAESKSSWDMVQGSCTNFSSDYNDFFNTRAVSVMWNESNYDWYSYLAASQQDTHSLSQDPLFVDPAGFDFHLRPSSPLAGKGVVLTSTTDSGNGNVITVADASYFSDGFGIGEGDEIVIASNQARVIAIDYASNKITLDRAIMWEKGDGVSFPFSGAAPDMGARDAK
jgi:parallel beta-helix repeat protein